LLYSILGAIGLLVTVMAALSSIVALIAAVWRSAAHRFGYEYFRRAHSFPSEVAMDVVYAPAFSTMSAVIVGTGVNILTGDRSRYDLLFGPLFVALGFLGVLVSGREMATQMSRRGGLRAARSALARGFRVTRGTEGASAREISELIKLVERWHKVGLRLSARGASFSLQRWIRASTYRRRMAWVTIGCHTLVALFYPVVVFGRLNFYSELDREGQGFVIAYLIFAPIFVGIFVASVLWSWLLYRHRCARVGSEFTVAANRLVPLLTKTLQEQIARESPPAVDTPAAPGSGPLVRLLARFFPRR
jgi:hypothetical protein